MPDDDFYQESGDEKGRAWHSFEFIPVCPTSTKLSEQWTFDWMKDVRNLSYQECRAKSTSLSQIPKLNSPHYINCIPRHLHRHFPILGMPLKKLNWYSLSSPLFHLQSKNVLVFRKTMYSRRFQSCWQHMRQALLSQVPLSGGSQVFPSILPAYFRSKEHTSFNITRWHGCSAWWHVAFLLRSYPWCLYLCTLPSRNFVGGCMDRGFYLA